MATNQLIDYTYASLIENMALSNRAKRRFENLQEPARSILFLDKAVVWRFGVSLVISSSPDPSERMRVCKNLSLT